MPHTRKKRKQKNKIINTYTPIEQDHCSVGLVIDSILHCISTNWMTKSEWEKIVEEVNKKII